jgi:hypothetical protein
MNMFEIWSHGRILGETELEVHDTGMNVRSGRFRPRQDYFGVRSVFKAYSAAVDMNGDAQQRALLQYYQMRDELELELRDGGGARIPSGTIHIADFEDSVEEMEIEVYPPVPDHSMSDSDTRDSLLRQFFGGYFHQDWDISGPTWVHVVDQFVRDHRTDVITETRDALQSWLDVSKSTENLSSDYACEYNPRNDGVNDRTWVQLIVDRLNELLR